jgi:hypothetical protein
MSQPENKKNHESIIINSTLHLLNEKGEQYCRALLTNLLEDLPKADKDLQALKAKYNTPFTFDA